MDLDPFWQADFPTERTLDEWCRREILPGSKGPSEMGFRLCRLGDFEGTGEMPPESFSAREIAWIGRSGTEPVRIAR